MVGLRKAKGLVDMCEHEFIQKHLSVHLLNRMKIVNTSIHGKQGYKKIEYIGKRMVEVIDFELKLQRKGSKDKRSLSG